MLLHAIAFIIWDVGSRSPSQLLDDVSSAIAQARRRSPRSLRTGLWRLVLGSAFLLCGATLMLSATIVNIRTEFTVLEIIGILSGLLVESLVGSKIRTHLFSR